MAYSAIVLDNTEFFTKGTITVRVAKYFNAPFTWDLSNDTSILKQFEQLKKENKVEDFNNCLVSTPLGGGRNYGLFMLPQINSVGRVSFLDDTFSQPVWEGAFFKPHHGDNFVVEYVGIPNDQEEQEGENTDGAKKGKNIQGDEGTIILRQKTTNKDDYNWQEANTQNLVVLDGEKLKIIHFFEWDGTTPKKWQEILLENGEVKIENKSDDNTTSFLLKEKEMKMSVDDGEESSVTLSTSDPGIKITLSGNNAIELLGTGDFLTKYEDLLDIIERLADHKHTCPITGITPDVLDGGTPFGPSITNPKRSMKAERIKTE